MKRFKHAVFLLVILFCISEVSGIAFGGEIDILVDKLVEKGILTQSEAQEILIETKEEIRAELAAGKSETVPKWVQNTEFKGDYRLRYQIEKRKGTTNQRERVRGRLRFGFDSKVNENTKVAVSLATGSRADLRGTNQTFGGNPAEAFGKYDIWLDQAWLEYAPLSWLTLEAGKMPLKDVFWQAGDLVFDGDINPDGGIAVTEFPLTDTVKLINNTGWLILSDGNAHADVTMAFLQPRIEWKINEKNKLKAGAAYYHYNSLKGKDISSAISNQSAGTNSHDDLGGLKYDFNSFGLNGEFSIKEPFSFLPNILYLAVFGDYINNPDASSGSDGFLVGFKFGDEEVKDKGQWQAKYMYRELGKDAVLDFLPDSDTYSGSTDIKANEFILDYGLGKNMTFGLDYYMSDRLKATKAKEHLLQADLVVKF